jgi:hypothetical protein
MIKIMFQFLTAHRHHTPRELAKAMYKGEPVPGLDYRDWASIASTLETEEWTVQEKVQNAAFS